ncbi:MAG: tRNA uridine-5-carboxymethylaminomethyl(34) synthesis enzyme MnmG [Marinilabiliales bacterium]|nr:MAG: tRNA uridine-5-carboxymethylaminomethyl(34) synthesis enzyme MnmG [Marinilabiliales bacterium]
MAFEFDIIVVGAGHAGCEAAAAAANLGSSVLLITMDMERMAQMSCNPAIGGVAKGQIVREIDALGGYTGIITDRTTIHFRMLNQSKGPAMWSPRAQCDRIKFSAEWRNELELISNLSMWQDIATKLLIEDNSVIGVETNLGVKFYSKSVILTNGTFLNGLMHIGKVQTPGGRISEPESKGLSEQVASLGFSVARMKTGTPARLDGRTIDFNQLEEQASDEMNYKFSFVTDHNKYLQYRKCYIAYTNEETHNIINQNIANSPMFDGTIQSIGPRYCPSIEQKLVTFSDKPLHQLFLEPEGESTIEYYLNGFSSSLPWEVQYKAIRTIKGFENAKIFRPGYAIEYDFFDPTQLKHTLETKIIRNLYFAGQINGTTGYEEAGAQGMIAGINAHNKINNRGEFLLNRNEAYIGVLIDDLVTKGVDEPYRMFTSRAEHRILLRQDNADIRLTPKTIDTGLCSDERKTKFLQRRNKTQDLIDYIKNKSISMKVANDVLNKIKTSPLKQGTKLYNILLRPQVNISDILQMDPDLKTLTDSIQGSEEILASVEIECKYAGYIEKEKSVADKIHKLEEITIPDNFDYGKLKSISFEAREKLTKIKPKTIGQASRIIGVSPADINVLLVYFGR